MPETRRTARKLAHLRLKSEFDLVRQTGRKQVGTGMLAVVAPSPNGEFKCGVICGKKYSLLAVERNRARRLLWESLRLLSPHLQNSGWIVLIPRKRMMEWKRQQATRELAKLFAQEGILSREVAASPPEC